MKCPKCNKEGCKYIEPRKSKASGKSYGVRDNFLAKHSKCNFSGIA